jgi:hypothetical protein
VISSEIMVGTGACRCLMSNFSPFYSLSESRYGMVALSVHMNNITKNPIGKNPKTSTVIHFGALNRFRRAYSLCTCNRLP